MNLCRILNLYLPIKYVTTMRVSSSDWDQFVDLETGEYVGDDHQFSDYVKKYLDILISSMSLRRLGQTCLFLVGTSYIFL